MGRQRWRWTGSLLVLWLPVFPLAGCGQAASSSMAPAPPPMAQWQLTWADEFDGAAGTAPDTAKWTVESGVPPDGAQSYNCGTGEKSRGCDPAKPSVSLDGGGHLAIVARAAVAAPNGVTGGRLKTMSGNNSKPLFSTQYGRVEASIAVPTGNGNQGVWPAFWMLGTNIAQVSWPACGEIDILEYIGKKDPTEIYATLHGTGYDQPGLGVRSSQSAGWSGFHTYGMIWAKDQVQFYVDDPANVYGTFNASQLKAGQAWPFNSPFYLILDLNMGGPFPGNVDATTMYPQTMLVDYVRVYQFR